MPNVKENGQESVPKIVMKNQLQIMQSVQKLYEKYYEGVNR